MYEILAVINGKTIFRMKGMRACYHVLLKGDIYSTNVTCHFRTLKAAKAYCEAH